MRRKQTSGEILLKLSEEQLRMALELSAVTKENLKAVNNNLENAKNNLETVKKFSEGVKEYQKIFNAGCDKYKKLLNEERKNEKRLKRIAHNETYCKNCNTRFECRKKFIPIEIRELACTKLAVSNLKTIIIK